MIFQIISLSRITEQAERHEDTIKYIKKRNIEDRRNEIVKLMRNYKVVSEQDQIELDKLVAEKMELDTQVQILKN